MKDKTLIAIVGTIGLILVIYLASNSLGDQDQASPAPQPTIQERSPTPTQPSDEEGEVNFVSMINITFQPSTITIKEGQTVTWRNEDPELHTVTIPELDIDQNVQSGATFQHTFTAAGTYDYECTIHPGMEGTIIVESENIQVRQESDTTTDGQETQGEAETEADFNSGNLY